MNEFEDTNINFLGLEYNIENVFYISQLELIKKVLNKCYMNDWKTNNVLVLPELQLFFEVNECTENLPYTEFIRCLMYIILGSRGDSFSISYFSQFPNFCTKETWKNDILFIYLIYFIILLYNLIFLCISNIYDYLEIFHQGPINYILQCCYFQRQWWHTSRIEP